MGVFQDKKRNTWFVQIKAKDPVSGKTRWISKRGFKLKREALQWEAERLIEQKSPGTDTTFLDMMHRWEDSEQATDLLRANHMRHVQDRFAKFINTPISRITKAQLSQWRTDLASDTNYKSITKNKTVTTVKAVFRFYSDTYDGENVASFLKSIKCTDEEIIEKTNRIRVWTPEQFKQFLDAIPDKWMIYKLFFSFLFWTGCRRGEAMALHKEDVHEDYVMIKYTFSDDGKLTPTKTKTSRKVYLDEKTRAMIEPLMSVPGPFLFGGDIPLPRSTIRSVFHRGTVSAGLPNITVHGLRHSHASILIASGVNIVAVSKRLGHASIEQTINTYTHLLEASEDDMMVAINAIHQKSM